MNRRGLLKALLAAPLVGLAAKRAVAAPPKPEPPLVTLAKPEMVGGIRIGTRAIDAHGNEYAWLRADIDVPEGGIVQYGAVPGLAKSAMRAGEVGWVQIYGSGVTWVYDAESIGITPKRRKRRRKK